MTTGSVLPGISGRIIDADAIQTEAAEIKPRACCPIVVAEDMFQGDSRAAD